MSQSLATFDLVVRDLPNNRNFMLLGGTEEIIRYILNLRFKKQHIKVLQDNGLIGKEFAAYLRKFKFSGSVSAMPEGTPFFPGEPIVRVTAPIIEANLLYVCLLNILVSNTVFLTKAIRTYLVAGGKTLLTNAGRAQGMEPGSKFARAAYLAGFAASLQLSGVLKFNIPMPEKFFKSTFHAYIKAFRTELEAMMAFVEEFPNNEATLMIDTYGLEAGLENAIKVCEKLKERGKSIHSVFVDSGDLFQGATFVRRRLDEAGFPDVKIILASSLNEWKVKELVDEGAPADYFMVITELATCSDDPKLEVVYKMAQVDDGKTVRETMKLAPGKKSLPGKKQVYRVEESGKFKKDIIGLEDDSVDGTKLLIPMVEKGELIYLLPKLEDIRRYVSDQVSKLPDNYRRLEVQNPAYLVEVSPKLQDLSEKIQKQHNDPTIAIQKEEI